MIKEVEIEGRWGKMLTIVHGWKSRLQIYASRLGDERRSITYEKG